jgi:hypothetical protein
MKHGGGTRVPAGETVREDTGEPGAKDGWRGSRAFRKDAMLIE